MKILPVSMAQAKEQNSSFFIELYNIHLKTGIIRICNCDEVIVFAGLSYQPVPIERGTIKSTVDAKIDNMDLKIADADNSKVAALMEGFDFRGRKVEIFRIQYPESLEDSSIAVPVFYGTLDAPSYSNGEFSCTIRAMFPKSKVPFRTTQYFCNNTFGDEFCKMDKAIITGNIQESASLPYEIKTDIITEKDKYKNGLCTLGYETRMIKSNTEDGYFILYYPFLGDLKGTVTVSRNCDKTPEMCKSFDNRKNYGGFIAIPKEFRLGT